MPSRAAIPAIPHAIWTMVSPHFPKTLRKTQADQQPGQPHRAGVAELWRENQMKNGSMFEYGIYIFIICIFRHN